MAIGNNEYISCGGGDGSGRVSMRAKTQVAKQSTANAMQNADPRGKVAE